MCRSWGCLIRDRITAGKLLADRLKDVKADLVLGIPRGGVVVAAEIAKDLDLPLDIMVTRKIGTPGQEELALGAVDPDGEVVWDRELLEQLNPPAGGLKSKIEEEKEEIKRREKLYRGDREVLEVAGKRVILVDDGIATGATILAAVRYLKRHGARIVLAVPVASQEALRKMEGEVDQSVVLEAPEYFQAVGQFYHQFEPVTDEEVVQLMDGR